MKKAKTTLSEELYQRFYNRSKEQDECTHNGNAPIVVDELDADNDPENGQKTTKLQQQSEGATNQKPAAHQHHQHEAFILQPQFAN